MFTPEEIRAAAIRVFAGNFSDLGSNENLAQAVSQRYGDLTTLKGLTEEQLNTLYGQTLQRDVLIKVQTDGLQELEQAGNIIDGISSAVEKIESGNIIESFRSMQNLGSMFAEEAQARAAYERIANGRGTNEDWNTVASFYGINAQEYQTGRRNIGSLGNIVYGTQDLYRNSGNVVAQTAVSMAYANKFNAQLSQESLDKWMREGKLGEQYKYFTGESLEDYMATRGFKLDENGNYVYDKTSVEPMTWREYQQQQQAIVDSERRNRQNAAAVYDILQNGNYTDLDQFMEYAEAGEYGDYIKSLTNSGALANMQSLQQLAAYLFSNSTYGTYAEQPAAKYGDASKYIDALFGGNVDVLKQLENNTFANAYLQNNISGWSELVGRVIAGETLGEAE